MVEKILMPGRNVVDFAKYQQARRAAVLTPALLPLCRHCGALLGEGEREEECSGAGFSVGMPPLREALRKFVAE